MDTLLLRGTGDAVETSWMPPGSEGNEPCEALQDPPHSALLQEPIGLLTVLRASHPTCPPLSPTMSRQALTRPLVTDMP